MNEIRGSGGGKGGGSDGGASEASNTLRSSQKAIILDALCEGPIVGLVNGAQSVFFDKTSLQNADGSYNFNRAIFAYTTGDIASNYSAISQLGNQDADVESTTAVGVQVRKSTPVVRNVLSANLDALRVTISVPSLTYQDPKSGNISGASVEYCIDVSHNEGGFVTVVQDTISGKTTSRYARSYLIPLTGAGHVEVRVVRVTPDATESNLQNQLWFDDFTAIVSTRLEYRHTAIAGVSIDAQQFSSIPERAYDIRGLIINIPNNYDPITRAYTGVWDGTFKLAWSDNPAWCFYDLLTNGRYGLGDMIDIAGIDKWQLYVIGKYCDELVPDGFGGQEPRFTCNLYIQSEEDAYKVIQNLASIFRAVVFWSAGSIAVMQDAPSDPIQLFTSANVISGAFKYQGTSLKSRHTVALVTWNDPNDWYQQKIEYVQDDSAVAKYGVIKIQVTAFGCTSRGQANRVGRWILYSEQLETETISFRCGMDGAYVYPGAVIQTSDSNRAGKRMGGRVVSVSSDLLALTVDAAIDMSENVHRSIQIAMPDGTLASEQVCAIEGNKITLARPLEESPLVNAVYLVSEERVQAELWRVVTISEVEHNQLEISALAHHPGKYEHIEKGLQLTTPTISSLQATPEMPTNLSVITAPYFIDIGIAGIRLTFSWSGSAARYQVSYQKENGQRVSFTQDQHSVDIDNIDAGVNYTFTVIAISTLGFSSKAASLTTVINAPSAIYPPNVTEFNASITGNGVQLHWRDIAYPMLYDYEIREGKNWDEGTSLGFFNGTSVTLPPLIFGTYQWMIKARDKLFTQSFAPAVKTFIALAPEAPTVCAQFLGENYVLSWSQPKSMFLIDHYVIKTGEKSTDAVQIASTYTVQYQSKVTFAGTALFWIAAVDVAGNIGTFAVVQLSVTPPSQLTITTQVIDNNVLFYWNDATQSLPVVTYQLLKGSTFENAVLVGTKSGLFTTLFETVAGTYTYWIAGVDSAGNVGVASSITATVNSPPDYILHSDVLSKFDGTLSNALLEKGMVVLPVDLLTTWEQHFSSKQWSSVNDQIAAGYSIYGQPTLSSGYYEEIIDYETILAATNVTVTPTFQVIAGNPNLSITISSRSSINGPWVDYVNTSQVYITNFRWIKVRVTVACVDKQSFLSMSDLEIKLDVKLKNDAGSVQVRASDLGGTNVNFNVSFINVTSITVTPQGSSPSSALYDFNGVTNPKNFQVYLFNQSGQRVSGKVSWAAKGY